MPFNDDQVKKIDSFLRIHIGKEHGRIPSADKIAQLYRKDRKYWVMMGVNILAIAFFAYSFLSGVTRLDPWVFYGLIAVFVLNIVFLSYQKRRIKEAIHYLSNAE
jgi:FtsH-binding integral membrane protein